MIKMKKNWRLLSIIMVAMFSLCLFSCNDDDHGDDSGKNERETDYSTANAVDLGLSVKWASWNVGAKKDSEVGNFYFWGETETKNYFDENNYIFNETYSPTNIANTQYDVAHVKWGEKWRMPTDSEIRELISCESRKVTRNGREGYMFYGKNGNTIFLPATGLAYKSEIMHDGVQGWYWSSTRSSGNSKEFLAHALNFDINEDYGPYIYDGTSPTRGCVVRPVCEY